MNCPKCNTTLHVLSDIYEQDAKLYVCITCGYEYVKKPIKLRTPAALLPVANRGKIMK